MNKNVDINFNETRNNTIYKKQSVSSSNGYSYGLFEHLKYWCSINPEYEMLLAALIIDINIFSEILDSVVLSYGNYSRHDNSHSKSILRSIEQLLGEKQTAMLSATDTWLILETAYGHDIGMALTEQEITDIWNSSSFKEFLLSLLDSNNKDSLYLANTFFDIQKNDYRSFDEILYISQKEFGHSCSAILHIGSKIRTLVAEYVRYRHAERSGNAIKDSHWLNEDTYNGIQNRLYKLCSECSIAHGIDRKKIIECETLPMITNGFSSDYAHPRFVAMLLRMGDLLDIDNNRFNKYVTAAFGKLSETSSAHKDKHRCITHLYISPKEIEINADLTRLIVDDSDETKLHLIETYKETQNWFDYISDELDFWRLYGYCFIPKGFFYPIPILKNRDIFINGRSYNKGDILDSFKISYDRARQIIGSKPFYGEPLVFIRELVQNAYDAYKYQIGYMLNDSLKQAHSAKESIAKESFSTLFSDTILELNKAHICLNIAIDANQTGEKRRLRIAVCDNGEGISKSAYKRMRSVGERGNRKTEHMLLPGWIKTTGEFGIGLHSAFTVTNKINYRTYCPSYMDRFQLELSIDGGGRIIILPKEVWTVPERKESGTDVWITVELDRISNILFPDDNNDISDQWLIAQLLASIKRVLAPNVAPLKINILESRNSIISDLQLVEAEKRSTIVFSDYIPDLFSFVDKEKVLENENFYYLTGASGNKYSIITLSKKTLFNENDNNLCLRLDFSDFHEEIRISHKGSWITGKIGYDSLVIKGLNVELHLLGRKAGITVTTQRENLLSEAIPDIKHDLMVAFNQLLISMAQQNYINEIQNQTTLIALAKHYITALSHADSDYNSATINTALSTIKHKIKDIEVEGYDFCPIDSEGMATLNKTSISIDKLVCTSPQNNYFIYSNFISRQPIGLHPQVCDSGLTTNAQIYNDIWSDYEIDLSVSELFCITTKVGVSLIVRYTKGKKCIPVLSNIESFKLLLFNWLKQIKNEESIQFIPAVELGKEFDSSLNCLAVDRCDYLSNKQWKLFHSYIKMPVLPHVRDYDSLNGNLTQQLTYSNLYTTCPSYIKSLIEYTYENQVIKQKYSKEQISLGYKTLISMLVNIQT